MAIRPPKKSKAEQEAAAAAEAEGGSSSGGGPDQQQAGAAQQQAALPPGVTPEMQAMLQRMLADKGGALHAAAARIQANYRGYRVRQVCRGQHSGLRGWADGMQQPRHNYDS